MTSRSGTSRNGRVLKIIGGSLLVIAIGFIALFAVLIANDTAWSTTTRVPVFFLSCAAVLAFVGWLYLKPESQLRSPTDAPKLVILLGKSGRLIELLALAGFVLMLARALCVGLGINWPSPVALWILVAIPLAILLSMKKILVPDTFQTGFFLPSLGTAAPVSSAAPWPRFSESTELVSWRCLSWAFDWTSTSHSVGALLRKLQPRY